MHIRIDRTSGRDAGGRGLTLLEVVLAFTIFAVAVVPVLSLFLGSSRLQDKVTGLFREAVAAQIVWETLRSRTWVNPYFLRELAMTGAFEARQIGHPDRPGLRVLALVHTGGFVPTGAPRDEEGRPVGLSIFAQHLIDRSGGQLYAAENRATLDLAGPVAGIPAADVASLHHNFRDLVVRLWVFDGLLPAWSPGRPPARASMEQSELVRDVIIEVFRQGPNGRIPPRPSFRLRTTLETPGASLSPSMLRTLDRNRDDHDYERDLAEAYDAVREGLLSAGLRPSAVVAVANLMLVIAETIGEAIHSEGSDLGFGVPDVVLGRGFDYWIDRLRTRPHIKDHRRAAELLGEKARAILQAFRRSREAIDAVGRYGLRLEGAARRLADRMESRARSFAASRAGGRGQEAAQTRSQASTDASKNRGVLIEMAFWEQLLRSDRWTEAVRRPLGYSDRYLGSLVSGAGLHREVEVHPRATPLDRVRALNAVIEVDKAQKLHLDVPTLADDALVAQRAAAYERPMLFYAEALRADDLADLPTLRGRNERHYEITRALRAMTAPDHPYRKAVDFLANGGMGAVTRRMRRAMAALDLAGALQAFDRTIGGFIARKRTFSTQAKQALAEEIARERRREEESGGE